MPNIQAVEIGRVFFCVKGAPAVQVTAPTAFNIGRFCFADLGYIYDKKMRKILGVPKYFFTKCILKGTLFVRIVFPTVFKIKHFLFFSSFVDIC